MSGARAAPRKKIRGFKLNSTKQDVAEFESMTIIILVSSGLLTPKWIQ